MNIKKCVICDRNLQGKQTKYCSSKCKDKKKQNKYLYTCKYCGETGYSTNKKQMFCNRSHSSKFNAGKRSQRGEKNPNWKGGIVKHSAGYLEEYCPNHPRAKNRRYVLQHILQMERALGRLLRNGDVVHHKNFVKDDNRIENLHLMLKKEHDKLHRNIRKHFRETNQLPLSTIAFVVSLENYISDK